MQIINLILKFGFIAIILFLLTECDETESPQDNKNNNNSKNIIIEDIIYYGAFKLPEGRMTITDELYGTFQSAGGAAVYNPTNKSMIFAARSETKYYQRKYPVLAEVSIPEPLIGHVDELPVAELISGYKDCFSNVIKKIEATYGRDEGHGIGGLLVSGDYLFGSIYQWHNCGEPLPVSHFYTTLDDFYESMGPFAIDADILNGFAAPSGAMAGYMSLVPEQWRNDFSFNALTGGLHGSENGGCFARTSNGPAAFGFNPKDFLTADIINGSQFIYHPTEQPLDSVYYNKSHNFNGMAFVSFSSGGVSKSAIIYALTFGNPPYLWDSGYRATTYDAKLFFYSLDDLLAVKVGEKKQYELTPYKTINLSSNFYNKACKVKSMAYDTDKNRLYIIEDDGNDPYPVVHVYGFAD